VESPFSAFYVVTRNEKIVAQSWVWRTKNNGLVLDSIEAIDRSESVIEAAAQLWQAAALQLMGQLGIKTLFIGKTTSGITRPVRNALSIGATECTHDAIDYSGYYDGRTHCLWVGEVQGVDSIAYDVNDYRIITKESHSRFDFFNEFTVHVEIDEEGLVVNQYREQLIDRLYEVMPGRPVVGRRDLHGYEFHWGA
jgi:hypothetical protein